MTAWLSQSCWSAGLLLVWLAFAFMGGAMSHSYSADIVLYFKGLPSVQQHITMARDRQHAIKLAEMNAQAKGWDLKKLIRHDTMVIGERNDR